MDNKICEIHNEPSLFCEQDAQQNIKLLCKFCVQQKLKIPNNDDNNEEQLAFQQLEQKYDQSIKQFQQFLQKLEQYTLEILQKLKVLKQFVEQNIIYIIEQLNYVKNKSNNYKNLQLNQINEEKNKINQQFTQIKQQINNQLQELEIGSKLDQLYQTLNNLQIQVINNQVIEQVQISEMIVFNKKFDYQLLQQSSYKQNECCYTIAFNNDATKMIAGCNQMIKVFEFKDERLRLVKQLFGYSQNVSCLQFMKNDNQFISGSDDSNLII